jgi:hypothetical protein
MAKTETILNQYEKLINKIQAYFTDENSELLLSDEQFPTFNDDFNEFILQLISSGIYHKEFDKKAELKELIYKCLNQIGEPDLTDKSDGHNSLDFIEIALFWTRILQITEKIANRQFKDIKLELSFAQNNALNELFEIFRITVFVISFDYSFVSNDNHLELIHQYRERLSRLRNPSKVNSILSDILLLYLKKIMDSRSISNTIDGSDRYNVDFVEFKNKEIENLYRISSKLRDNDAKSFNDISHERIADIKRRLQVPESSKIKVWDWVLAIKYYKDKKKNIEELTKLNYKGDSDILSIYFKNNLLSLLIDEYKNTKSENIEIKNLFNKISDEAEENKCAYNYFPYFKYLNYLEEKYNNLLTKTDSDVRIGEVLDEYREVFDRVRTQIQLWLSEDNSSIEFELDYEDCLVYVGENRVFLQSKYCMPDHIETLNTRYHMYELKREILLANYKSVKSFQEYQEKIKSDLKNSIEKEYEKIKEESSKKDIRSIEIITLFSAITMFVAGDIQIFRFVDNIEMLVPISLAFALSLIFFVLLVRRILSKEQYRSKVEPCWNKYSYEIATGVSTLIIAGSFIYFAFANINTSVPKKEQKGDLYIQINKDSLSIKK